MIPVYQTKSGKEEGNCWPAVLASILELSIGHVEHCAEKGERWTKNTDDFLARHGMFAVEIFYENRGEGSQWPITALPDKSLVMSGWWNQYTDQRHVVISRVNAHPDGSFDLTTVHDPNPHHGMDETWEIESIILLCKLSL